MLHRFFTYIVVFGLTLAASFSASAVGDIQQGKAKSATCVGCHGLNGIATAPNFPNLAGQKQGYLINAIESYRNGQRNNATMKAMVSSLNSSDIKNLAAYFSSLPRK